MNENVKILLKDIKKLKLKEAKISNDIQIKKAELKQICLHEDFEVNETYFEGNYFEKSQYITTTVCKICLKKLDEIIKIGNYN